MKQIKTNLGIIQANIPLLDTYESHATLGTDEICDIIVFSSNKNAWILHCNKLHKQRGLVMKSSSLNGANH